MSTGNNLSEVGAELGMAKGFRQKFALPFYLYIIDAEPPIIYSCVHFLYLNFLSESPCSEAQAHPVSDPSRGISLAMLLLLCV